MCVLHVTICFSMHALVTNNYIKYYIVRDYKIMKVVLLGLSNVKVLKC
jgi:hypothetical protein